MNDSDAAHSSGKHLLHNVAFDIGEPKVAALVPVIEPLVIQAQQVKHRGVQVVQMHLAVNCAKTVFVCLAVRQSTLDATAGKPSRIAQMVVAPAIYFGTVFTQ